MRYIGMAQKLNNGKMMSAHKVTRLLGELSGLVVLDLWQHLSVVNRNARHYSIIVSVGW